MTKTINSTATSFLYDGVNPVQELSGTTPTANLLTGLGIDEFFIRTDSLGTRAVLPNAVGSTIALADNTGTVQSSYTYEPFGNTTTAGSNSGNSFEYTGRENDGTGVYYYRARYYSPRLQRFISEDPLKYSSGDVNFYSYVYNNPISLVDPTGLEHTQRQPTPEEIAIGCILFLRGCGDLDPTSLGLPPLMPGGLNVDPGSLKKLPQSEVDRITKDQGFTNPEDFKKSIVGQEAKNYNLSADKNTGEIVLTPVVKGGGQNVPTGIFRK